MNSLIFCTAMLMLYGQAAAGSDYVGKIFYIPSYDLLGDDMTGGYPVFKNLPDTCIKTSSNPMIDSSTSFFEDTATFYSSLGTDTSISTELHSDFTMSTSLDATTKSISGSNRTVRGTTYISYSKVSSEVLQSTCMDQALDDSLKNDFESLAQVIDDPSPESSWSGYKAFLTKYGSHVVKEVFYGSSLYQHAFSDSNNQYTQQELNTKACASIGFGLSVSVCNGVTQEDINAVSSLTMSDRFIARGGTDETRAQLYSNRTDDAIAKFLSEANATHQPIQYKYVPIWVILQNKYIGTEHFTKAINMEAYYKGYLSYGCNYRTSGDVVLQKFHNSDQSTPDYPMFQCSIAPTGCQDDDDCHYRNAWWCECWGDSCIRYYTTTLNTGTERTDAEVFHGSGWGWQGCGLGGIGLSCYCNGRNYNWKVVWNTAEDDKAVAYAVHSRMLRGKIVPRKDRTEL